MCLFGILLWIVTATPLGFSDDLVLSPVPDNRVSSAQLIHSTVKTHQLCFIISKDFIAPWLRSEFTDTGPVRDQILGADVFGTQQTCASTSVDFVPSPCSGRVLIRLTGTTSNQTTSYTPQAAIQSVGDYRFELTKEVDFRGNQFTTRTPSAFLTVNQRNVGAATQLSHLPLIGPLANRTALSIADQRTPQARQIAAMKLTDQVAPRFNTEVDQRLAPLNQFLQRTLPALIQPTELRIPSLTARTSDQHLIVATSMEGKQPSIQNYDLTMTPPGGVSLLINDSLLNTLIGKVPLAGFRISDTRLKGLLEGKFQNFLTPARPQFVTLIFDDQEPLSVHFDQGEIRITVRMTVKPVLGPDIKSYQVVMLLRPEIEAQSIRLTPTIQSIGSLDPDAPKMGELIDNQIRDQLQQQIEPVILKRQIDIPASVPQRPTAIRIDGIQVSRGWLKIDADNSYRIEPPPGHPPLILRDNFIQIQQ